MYRDQVELGKCWEGASLWFSEPSRPKRPSSRHPCKWLYGQCLDMNIMYLTLYALHNDDCVSVHDPSEC